MNEDTSIIIFLSLILFAVSGMVLFAKTVFIKKQNAKIYNKIATLLSYGSVSIVLMLIFFIDGIQFRAIIYLGPIVAIFNLTLIALKDMVAHVDNGNNEGKN